MRTENRSAAMPRQDICTEMHKGEKTTSKDNAGVVLMRI